ncbi:hypothetical protein Cal6303_2146 [Calothrix sp. PCC 6303]|nr:hypothetical protein Cal6303_2146 [Calothrix sp. PCC 6303]
MNTPVLLKTKKSAFIAFSTLILLGFYTTFYIRIFTSVGIPSAINFLHLLIVPWACIFILTKTRIKNKAQIAAVKEIIFALFIFFTVNVASAFVNKAGFINYILNFLLLCEHFLLLLAIICVPMTWERIKGLRSHIVFAGFINTIFAYIQYYVFRLHLLGAGGADNIKGVFIGQGAGHVVGASVALSFGAFYVLSAKIIPIWLRLSILLITIWHMNIADAKQSILIFALAWMILLLTKFKNIGKLLQYLIVGIILIAGFYWCVQNIPEFRAFKTWIRPEIYGPDGEATLLKTSIFRIVPSYYQSFWNQWLGLGPGHTVGRLGGWLIKDYREILIPLGITIHPASNEVWNAVRDSWLGDQSSMFSPLFGWAGIWGDLGFLGLASFIYIWSVVWRRICVDDISRLFVICVFLFGLVLSQMEEPGYMLYISSIIAIQYQEHQYRKTYSTAEQPKTELKNPKTLKGWVKRLLLIS